MISHLVSKHSARSSLFVGEKKKKQREKFVLPAARLCMMGLCTTTENLCTCICVVRVNLLGRWYTPLGIFLALYLYNMQ